MIFDVGIDVGSVSINCAVLDETGQMALETPYLRHFGLVYEEVRRLLDDLYNSPFNGDGNELRSISFTGVHGQLLADTLSAPCEVETIAQVLGATHVAPGVRTIISIGGQDAALFQLAHEGDKWHLEAFNMNGPCASGTGSFIDQQAERLALSMYGADFYMDQKKLQGTLEDFIDLGLKSSSPAPVACRCTVFTKSDMIHFQNKGEPLANIIAGLHYGNAANYMSTIVANRDLADPIAFIGGMASNRLQVRAFRHYFPRLEVPPHHTSLGALGVALQAQKQGWRNRTDISLLQWNDSSSAYEFPRAAPLELRLTAFDSDNSLPRWTPHRENPVQTFLGVDIGSTSTKYALIDDSGRIVHKCYLPTQGKPIEVTGNLLRILKEATGKGIRIMAIATTGSGRNVVGDYLSADLVMDEITAHAKGAVAVDAEIDTIFEIGGQDSKYIRIEKTHPLDFDMNKVCAAGTGSFLHELANKMKINIVGEFQDVALSSSAPIHLAERCTVFMESDLAGYAQKGARREDLIAGLCYAIVYNYLNRVVEKRHVGRRVMFLGGPSLNRGIVAAFEKVLGRPVIVPKHREVLGAFGAALEVRDMFHQKAVPLPARNLRSLSEMEIEYSENICRADKKCRNECKLKIYDFGGHKSIWGGECGRYEVGRYAGAEEKNYFRERDRFFKEALEGERIWTSERKDAGGHAEPVIGIPLSLHAVEWGILWAHVFSELGFNVLFSPPTNTSIILSGVERMTSETCFPVKVFHGHVRYLLDRTDLLFLPNVIDMPTPRDEETGFFCPLVESAQYMVRAALRIPDERMIRPTLYLKEGPDELARALYRSLPEKLRRSRNEIRQAVGKAWERQTAFRTRLLQHGREILTETGPDEPVWIVTGRPYNLYDERLNLQMGRHLARLGIKALPMDFLDLDSEDLSDFPMMYWGLGAKLLRAVKKIARTPNWYGMHLTNFSCGADSFIEHFYRHVLQEKPSLILELDEHSAAAGVLTRIEAYRNVVKNLQERPPAPGGETRDLMVCTL